MRGFRVNHHGLVQQFRPLPLQLHLRDASATPLGVLRQAGGGFFTGATRYRNRRCRSPTRRAGGLRWRRSIVTKGHEQLRRNVMRLLGKMVNKVCYFRAWRLLARPAQLEIRCRRDEWELRDRDLIRRSKGRPDLSLHGHVLCDLLPHPADAAERGHGGRRAAFPWTTGTVTVTATGRGPNNTIEQRQGYRQPNRGRYWTRCRW